MSRRTEDDLADLTVVDLLRSSTSSFVLDDGATLSAAELLSRGERVARQLQTAGVGPGDRVAVQMTNGVSYLEMLAGCALGRSIVMSVNTRFASELSESLIARSGATLVVRRSQDLPPAVGGSTEPLPPSRPDDRFVIFTTSGTTSAPKLVAHTQRSIAVHAREVAEAFGHDDQTVLMIALPLCGTFGLTGLFTALAANATIIMPESFDPDGTAQLVEQHQVSVMHGTDDMFHRMLASGHDLSSLRHSGYARFNSSLDGIATRAEAAGFPLSGLYGMSEVQALFSWRDPTLEVERRWLPGGELVSATAQCRVVDDELQLQGPSLFEGYLADGGDEIDADLTSRNFDGPWFRTGDHAEHENARSFRYISRLGDALRLGGFLVAPAEIEGVLCQRPEIAEAQVVAVDLVSGARPVAFVIPVDGAELDEAAIISHCQAQLAKFKSPVRVVGVDAFPVTDGPNGVKIQRNRLRDQALALVDSAPTT